MPPLPADFDPPTAFNKVNFNYRIEDLRAEVEAALQRTFREKIAPRYNSADRSTTKLRGEDVEDLCMCLMRTIGEWRNGMFLEPPAELTVTGSDLAPSGRKLDMIQFAGHLRNEVFEDLRSRFGWGSD